MNPELLWLNLRVKGFFAVVVWSCLTVQLSAGEMRGLWVDAFGPGFKTEKEVKELVADCRKYNFNAIFVQMRKRGDAYYFPKGDNPDPRAPDIAADYDALAEIIKQCHEGEPRIQVHCWLVAYFVWAFDKPPQQKQHLFNVRPDLFMRDSIGQKQVGNGYYLDPGHPEVNRILLGIAKDVVQRYDVDGLHWDYLRYPNRDSGYGEVALARFKKETATTNDPAPDDPKFCEWRRQQITHFVRTSTSELHRLRPNLIVSASVFSNAKDSSEHRMADWVQWNREGLLDTTVPMDFSPDNKFAFDPRADFARTNQGKSTVWLGIGAYMNPIDNTLRQLKYAREKGFAGTVLYSYRNFSNKTTYSEQEKRSEAKFDRHDTITLDNSQATVVGPWKIGEFGKMHGDDYLFIPGGHGSNTCTFSHAVAPGRYDVYEWHVAGKNRGTNVLFNIKPDLVSHNIYVNQREAGSKWNLLGTFPASNRVDVIITDKVSDNRDVAIADAVRLVLADTTSNNLAGGRLDSLSRLKNECFTRIREEYQRQWVYPDLPSPKN